MKSIYASHLRSGKTTSCGKCGKQIDILHRIFGRLAVISKTENRDSDGNVIWKCRCQCGNSICVPGSSLRKGNTQSCGCLHRERFTNLTHGMSSDPLYGVWTALLQRCYNPSNPKYVDYGGRGIKVCEEWRIGFEPFRDWAMASGYERRFGKERLTIDRRDNDKGYSPENCRWATYSVQNKNRRLRKPKE